uniref:Uncharacterized protein n=1 Tax=Glossina palpalis gambiensis TaxID=67801 RepID=A0A1B0BQX5_9MUSC
MGKNVLCTTNILEMRLEGSHGAASSLRNLLYVVGGKIPSMPLRTAECYNPLINTWTDIPPRSYLGDMIYACGGNNGKVSHHRVECYDILTSKWITCPNMSYNLEAAQRQRIVFIVYNDKSNNNGTFRPKRSAVVSDAPFVKLSICFTYLFFGKQLSIVNASSCNCDNILNDDSILEFCSFMLDLQSSAFTLRYLFNTNLLTWKKNKFKIIQCRKDHDCDFADPSLSISMEAKIRLQLVKKRDVARLKNRYNRLQLIFVYYYLCSVLSLAIAFCASSARWLAPIALKTPIAFPPPTPSAATTSANGRFLRCGLAPQIVFGLAGTPPQSRSHIDVEVISNIVTSKDPVLAERSVQTTNPEREQFRKYCSIKLG